MHTVIDAIFTGSILLAEYGTTTNKSINSHRTVTGVNNYEVIFKIKIYISCNYSVKKAEKLLDRVLREFDPILITSCAWMFEGERIAAGAHIQSTNMQLATPSGWRFKDSLSDKFQFVPDGEARH